MNKFSEKDWKIFRSKIAGWQETYMDKLNKEYIEILSGDGKPSEKFWALEKRIKADKKDCGVQCEMSRSNQFCAQAKDRREYKKITKNIAQLIKWKGNDTAKSLIEELMQRYPRKPALLDELEKVEKKL